MRSDQMSSLSALSNFDVPLQHHATKQVLYMNGMRSDQQPQYELGQLKTK